tara:strand:+ start:84 stop:770 length:687 start_codon:yes stop_codon:yes gene_type:complete
MPDDLLAYIQDGPTGVAHGVAPVLPNSPTSTAKPTADPQERYTAAKKALDEAEAALKAAEGEASSADAELKAVRLDEQADGEALALVQLEAETCAEEIKVKQKKAELATVATEEAKAAVARVAVLEEAAVREAEQALEALEAAKALVEAKEVKKALSVATAGAAEDKYLKAHAAVEGARDKHSATQQEEAAARELAELFSRILADKSRVEYEMASVVKKVSSGVLCPH